MLTEKDFQANPEVGMGVYMAQAMEVSHQSVHTQLKMLEEQATLLAK